MSGDTPGGAGDDDDRQEAVDLRPVHERAAISSPAEYAAAALNRARAAAAGRGFRPGRLPKSRPRGSDERSGAHADGRDPMLVGDTLSRLAAERGWQTELSVGSVRGRWPEIVGAEVAAHCEPETFEDGVLRVRADSTAWAQNLLFLVPDLLRLLEREVGEGVVRDVRVHGPAGPSWTRGTRHVKGRGPRDTYG